MLLRASGQHDYNMTIKGNTVLQTAAVFTYQYRHIIQVGPKLITFYI
jgi:hypothetical protein